MPSSQPVQQRQYCVWSCTCPNMWIRTFDNTPYANRGDEVASAHRRVEPELCRQYTLVTCTPIVRGIAPTHILPLLLGASSSKIHPGLRENLLYQGAAWYLPVYSIETSSCFLGKSAPLPHLMTSFSTPMFAMLEIGESECDVICYVEW